MFRMYGRVMLVGSMLLLLFLLAACNPENSPVNGKALTPTVVTARSVRGTPGSGPHVVTSPTSVPGGNAHSQQVELGDRTLVLNSVSKQDNADGKSSLITLVLTIRNTSNKAIRNEASFFQLMSAEGDTFTYQSNSSDTFYGDMSAHSSRDGTIVFQVPKAAASNLRLLYRPEVATETVLMPLNI